MHSRVVFSSKARLIASATDNSVTVWDLDKRLDLKTLKGHEGRITDICFHPIKPEILITVSGDGMARVRSWRKDETLEILADGTMTRARFSRCGTSSPAAVSMVPLPFGAQVIPSKGCLFVPEKTRATRTATAAVRLEAEYPRELWVTLCSDPLLGRGT